MKEKIIISITSILLAILIFFTTILLSFKISPNFFTFLVRTLPDPVSDYVPKNYDEVKENVNFKKDVLYPSQFRDNTFNIYYPKNYNNKMPVVIWIHGGFFLTSSKEVIEVYGTLMAN